MRRALLLLAAWAGAAAGADFLPDPAAAVAAIDSLPAVRAAQARQTEAGARSEALELDPYGFDLALMPTARNAHGRGTYAEWEAGVSRRVRLPGKADIDRKLGGTGIEVADLALADARHAGARLLLAQWLGWLRAAGTDELAAAQARTLEAERAAIATRARRGDLAELDVERAGALAAQAALAAERSAIDREQARLQLLQQFPGLVLPEPPPPLPEPPPVALDEAAAVERIVARSHEIGIALANARRQQYRAERASAERRPDPAVGVRVLQEADGDEYAVGLVLDIPFAAGSQAATARAEYHAVAAADAESAAVVQAIASDARRLARAAPARRAAWLVAQRALAASASALARMERAFALGEAGFADLALARRNRQEAALVELGARLDAHEAVLRLAIDSHELWSGHSDHHDEARGP